MCVARSGSSLTTSIFGAHGLWIGRQVPKADYPVYENEDIKNHLRTMVNRRKNPAGFRVLKDSITREQVREGIENIVPDNTPWVFKQGVDWWRVWDGLYEGTKFVFVMRHPKSVAQSTHKRTGRPYRRVLEVTAMYYEIMQNLSRLHGIPIVKTDEIVTGNFSSLEVAMRHCGLEFHPEAARKMIDRKRWHH